MHDSQVEIVADAHGAVETGNRAHAYFTGRRAAVVVGCDVQIPAALGFDFDDEIAGSGFQTGFQPCRRTDARQVGKQQHGAFQQGQIGGAPQRNVGEHGLHALLADGCLRVDFNLDLVDLAFDDRHGDDTIGHVLALQNGASHEIAPVTVKLGHTGGQPFQLGEADGLADQLGSQGLQFGFRHHGIPFETHGLQNETYALRNEGGGGRRCSRKGGGLFGGAGGRRCVFTQDTPGVLRRQRGSPGGEGDDCNPSEHEEGRADRSVLHGNSSYRACTVNLNQTLSLRRQLPETLKGAQKKGWANP